MDWRTGEKAEVTGYFDESIDIHHIFPKIWCDKAGFDPTVYNSIINKTPLTARTNRIIGGAAPSAHEGVAERIRSHLAQPDLMAADDFDGFFATGKAALLGSISAAMGKVILDDESAAADPGISLDISDDTDDL
ncbi:hypothetical protein [Streptomyces sp. NBC_01589]|uniref:hypothetical protein n=1 Tax=Streptomyces sp. NBC_01589 TaxID=2975886 RepID=UPI0038681420